MSDRTETIHERGPGGDVVLSDVESRLEIPLVHAMETQRAIRRVLPDPVDPAIIRRCIELALRAPTGSNGQNWEFVVVTDRDTMAAFATRYRQAWGPYETLGRRMADGDPDMEKILDAVRWQVDNFEDIPAVVVPALKGGRVPLVPLPTLAQSSFYGSIYPSVQNLLLAARAMGLGASLITLPLWSNTSIRRRLDLPLSVTPVCMVPLGWPRGRYGPTTRRDVDDVIHDNRYGRRFPS